MRSSGLIGDFDQWRSIARERLAAGVPPDAVMWSDERRPTLFAERVPADPAPAAAEGGGGSGARGASCAPRAASTPGSLPADVPKIAGEVLRLLKTLSCYRDASRWDLMYRLLWRIIHEGRALLENGADPDVRMARHWAKAISQDVHKMHAFVRFHATPGDDGEARYVAWFEPVHEILRCAVPFFEKRFGNMRWMIATPDGAAVWSGTHTEFIASPGRGAVSREDSTHALWRTYYRNICNVARINTRMMQREMPQRYWRNLPEATEIHSLVRENPRNLNHTLGAEAAEDVRVPRAISRTLDDLVPAADSPLTCRRCDLWRHATQAVLGEGPKGARIMLVGEQPGDEEDVRGRPFIGPAGRVLDSALRHAQLERAELFITNAVKHFKWEPRGKRRLHKKPHPQEVRACGGWLEREISEVAPLVIVALGATAIRAVTGLTLTIEEARSTELRHPGGALVIATYHPSAILRSPDERRALLMGALEEDLRRAAPTNPTARPAMLTANQNAPELLLAGGTAAQSVALREFEAACDNDSLMMPPSGR